MKHVGGTATALEWLVVAVLILAAATPCCFARANWTTLQGCRYLVKRFNDGDSFHVSVSGKEYIFRLYFVDAPETSAEFRDRVEEQARHFGISVGQTLGVGELAKRFTREKLEHPFVVWTCWEDAMGRSRKQRFYAFVHTESGDLGEQLVENGLARIHGASARPEGVTSIQLEWQRLTRLEQKAKQEKVGAWGAMEGRMAVRAAKPESDVDRFNAFFHPEKNARNTQNPAPATTSSVAAEAKLDINTASQGELENISGIGPVTVQRIMAARPFKSADDLRNVKGIGDKKYAKFRPFFR